MELLAISIICSVSVGILFKFSKLNFAQLLWVLFFGYIICFLSGFLMFEISWDIPNLKSKEFYIILFLAFLFPFVFISLQKSIMTQGIAKTDLVQRISLIIPILASFWIFQEMFSYNKIIAILLGFISIFLIMYKENTNKKTSDLKPLVIVFWGYGTVDVLLKTLTTLPFRSLLVFIFLGCIFTTLFYIIFKRVKFYLKTLPIGIGLGLLNFINIFTYLETHKSMKDSPTIVFTSMNLGVICLGTLVGVFLFKEKLSKWNFIGIICAIFAIIVLNFQMK